MQVWERRKIEMKRDMDLVRDLLLHIEEDPRFDGARWARIDAPEDIGITGHSTEEVAYHLDMLVEAGLLRGSIGLDKMPAISKLTWEGHEFLDNIRDHGIWSKTKARLAGLPSVAISIVGEIAKAEIKKHLGLP
jgi:Hypothetical protein (DUF2513)